MEIESEISLALAQWERRNYKVAFELFFIFIALQHGLRTPNEDVNQRYLKNWADVADKICFGRI